MLPNAWACLYHLCVCAFLIRFNLLLKNQGECGGIWQAVDADNMLFCCFQGRWYILYSSAYIQVPTSLNGTAYELFGSNSFLSLFPNHNKTSLPYFCSMYWQFYKPFCNWDPIMDKCKALYTITMHRSHGDYFCSLYEIGKWKCP